MVSVTYDASYHSFRYKKERAGSTFYRLELTREEWNLLDKLQRPGTVDKAPGEQLAEILMVGLSVKRRMLAEREKPVWVPYPPICEWERLVQ